MNNTNTVQTGTEGKTIHILNVFGDLYTEELADTIEKREEIAESLERRTGGTVTMNTIVPDGGAASLEDAVDIVTNAPYIIEAVQNTEEPFDAVVVDCFADPAVDALRQILDVPVVGVNQASSSIAIQLGRTFSVIAVLDETKPIMMDRARKYGFEDQLASMRSIDTGVIELEENPSQAAQKIASEAKIAVEKDGAHSVVLGCTGMMDIRQKAESLLMDQGIDIPIIEPLNTGIQTAVMMGRLGLTQSSAVYHPPLEKKRNIDFDIGV